MAGIELVCHGSARLLGGVEVEDVLVRGSYAEGGFRPFLSDIDLAILVRRPPDTHPYDACRSLHRRLRMVRLTNPFVRDTWQTIIPEPQWPLLRAFGGLYGAPRWRSLTGRAPLAAGPVEPRIALAAWWNRQHLWTCLAQRQALIGKETVRALPGSLRKARMYARRIANELGAARSATDEADPTLAGAIDELARSAELVRDVLGDGAEYDAAAAGIVVDPTPREEKALDAIERCPWALQLAGIASAEGCLLLLADGTWTSEQSGKALRDLVQVRRDTGVSVQLHRVTAVAMAPWRPPVRILRNRTTGALVPDSPFLLREQLVYEALYAATNLWAAAARRDPLPAIRAHLRSAAELCLFLLTDEPHRDARPVTELLAALGMHDDRLGARLPPIEAAGGSNARTAFAVADAITTKIADLLLERASRPAQERVS
ncbi:MAG TPA: nucleotidyltransferase domain-containing protein [Longimicrobiales bacterium]|nr:nucleotidyltransferase domain-containing protein [Longimicrobiales bacterium]